MRCILTLLCSLLLVSLLSAQTYDVTSDVNESNEVPPTGSPATATLTGTYDADANEITINVPYSGLTAGLSGAHLHKAPVGANGSIIVNLSPTLGMTSGTISGTFPVDPGDEADLLTGGVYINLHTSANPGGEIRGQLALLLQSNCELEVEAGDLCITDNASGLILKSPNGSCYRIQVDDAGNLTTAAVTCP